MEQRERQERDGGEEEHEQRERGDGEFGEGDEEANLAGAEEQPEQRKRHRRDEVEASAFPPFALARCVRAGGDHFAAHDGVRVVVHADFVHQKELAELHVLHDRVAGPAGLLDQEFVERHAVAFEHAAFRELERPGHAQVVEDVEGRVEERGPPSGFGVADAVVCLERLDARLAERKADFAQVVAVGADVGVDDGNDVEAVVQLFVLFQEPVERLPFSAMILVESLHDCRSGVSRNLGGVVVAVVGDDENFYVLRRIVVGLDAFDSARDARLLVVRRDEHADFKDAICRSRLFSEKVGGEGDNEQVERREREQDDQQLRDDFDGLHQLPFISFLKCSTSKSLFLCWLYMSLTFWRPALPNCVRSAGSSSNLRICLAKSSGSPGTASRPSSSCPISSGMPVMRVEMTGISLAIASMSTTGTPSAKLASTKISARS